MKQNEYDADLEAQAEELAAMLDALVESGSGHIHLQIGEETTVQTVNSTDCSGRLGACAVPTFYDDKEEDDSTEDSDEEDF